MGKTLILAKFPLPHVIEAFPLTWTPSQSLLKHIFSLCMPYSFAFLDPEGEGQVIAGS